MQFKGYGLILFVTIKSFLVMLILYCSLPEPVFAMKLATPEAIKEYGYDKFVKDVGENYHQAYWEHEPRYRELFGYQQDKYAPEARRQRRLNKQAANQTQHSSQYQTQNQEYPKTADMYSYNGTYNTLLMYGSFAMNLIINFLLYISIPIAIRYLFLRRPIKNKIIPVIVLLPIFLMFSCLINIQRDELQKPLLQKYNINEPMTHALGTPFLYMSMILSYGILRRRKNLFEKTSNPPIISKNESAPPEDEHNGINDDSIISKDEPDSREGEPDTPEDKVDSIDIEPELVGNNNNFYEIATQEITNKKCVFEIMAKANNEAGGDENKAYALYINLRVDQLNSQKLTEEQKRPKRQKAVRDYQLKNEKKVKEILDQLMALGYSVIYNEKTRHWCISQNRRFLDFKKTAKSVEELQSMAETIIIRNEIH